MARYHYLGYTQMSGQHLRYGVCAGGRGTTSTAHAAQLPVKDVWLYPLRQDFRRVLAE